MSFRQLFLRTCNVYVTRKKLPKRHSYEKRVYEVDEIDTRCQFHLCFKCKFFVQIFYQSQNVTRKSCQKGLWNEKFGRITLMKLTLGSKTIFSVLLQSYSPYNFIGLVSEVVFFFFCELKYDQ